MNLQWNERQVTISDKVFTALVSKSTNRQVLEDAQSHLKKENPDNSLVLFSPPSIIGEPVGFTPRGGPIYNPTASTEELWRFSKLGSFDSISFARDVLNSPSNDYLKNPVSFVNDITAVLTDGFEEGDFRLSFACEAFLVFDLIPYGTFMKKNQYVLLDMHLPTLFVPPSSGHYFKSKDASAPHCFLVGLV